MTQGEATAQATAAMNFEAGKTLPVRTFDEITELRVRRPNAVEQEAKRRKRRTDIAPDGRLVLVAVDHPILHGVLRKFGGMSWQWETVTSFCRALGASSTIHRWTASLRPQTFSKNCFF